MFEFYFPHIMESQAIGSWWPSLLGALISGGAAIFVFWWGKRTERITREKYLREELLHLVKLLREILVYKRDTYDKNQLLAENYKHDPLGHHPHKIEVNNALSHALSINPREIREALELFPGLNKRRDLIHSQIYSALNYYKAHADRNEKFIYEMKQEWNQYQLQIDEEILMLPYDLKIYLQRPDIKNTHTLFTVTFNKVVEYFLHEFRKNNTLKCGLDKFVNQFLHNIDDEYFKIPDFAVFVRRTKYLENIYNRLKSKGSEISIVLQELGEDLKKQNNKTLDLLEELETVFTKK